MSRIGKLPIAIPAKVKVDIKGQRIAIEGPKGKLQFDLPKRTQARVEADQILVSRQGDDRQAKALHGLSRAVVRNMVEGVSQGFSKRLEIHGVGFKAAVQGKNINLNLGFSHPVVYPIPDQIKVTVEENTKLLVEGPDKQLVGLVASEIRGFYPPEPYKGKGVRYSDERIIRKEGKTRVIAEAAVADPEQSTRHQPAPAHERPIFQHAYLRAVHRRFRWRDLGFGHHAQHRRA
jgi:large subunit ribosomal protein L6